MAREGHQVQNHAGNEKTVSNVPFAAASTGAGIGYGAQASCGSIGAARKVFGEAPSSTGNSDNLRLLASVALKSRRPIATQTKILVANHASITNGIYHHVNIYGLSAKHFRCQPSSRPEYGVATTSDNATLLRSRRTGECTTLHLKYNKLGKQTVTIWVGHFDFQYEVVIRPSPAPTPLLLKPGCTRQEAEEAKRINKLAHATHGNIDSHIERILSTKNLECPICYRRCGSYPDLRTHLENHEPGDVAPHANIWCQLCGQRCYNMEALTNHTLTCSNLKNADDNDDMEPPRPQATGPNPVPICPNAGHSKRPAKVKCQHCTFIALPDIMNNHVKERHAHGHARTATRDKQGLVDRAMAEDASASAGATDAAREKTTATREQMLEDRDLQVEAAKTRRAVKMAEEGREEPKRMDRVAEWNKWCRKSLALEGNSFSSHVIIESGQSTLLPSEQHQAAVEVIDQLLERGEENEGLPWYKRLFRWGDRVKLHSVPLSQGDIFQRTTFHIDKIILDDGVDHEGDCSVDNRPIAERFDRKLHAPTVAMFTKVTSWGNEDKAETIHAKGRVSLTLLRELMQHMNVNIGMSPADVQKSLVRVASRISYINVDGMDDYLHNIKINTVDMAYHRSIAILSSKRDRVFLSPPVNTRAVCRGKQRRRLLPAMATALVILILFTAFLHQGPQTGPYQSDFPGNMRTGSGASPCAPSYQEPSLGQRTQSQIPDASKPQSQDYSRDSPVTSLLEESPAYMTFPNCTARHRTHVPYRICPSTYLEPSTISAPQNTMKPPSAPVQKARARDLIAPWTRFEKNMESLMTKTSPRKYSRMAFYEGEKPWYCPHVRYCLRGFCFTTLNMYFHILILCLLPDRTSTVLGVILRMVAQWYFLRKCPRPTRAVPRTIMIQIRAAVSLCFIGNILLLVVGWAQLETWLWEMTLAWVNGWQTATSLCGAR